jgi:hypothetical protein
VKPRWAGRAAAGKLPDAIYSSIAFAADRPLPGRAHSCDIHARRRTVKGRGTTTSSPPRRRSTALELRPRLVGAGACPRDDVDDDAGRGTDISIGSASDPWTRVNLAKTTATELTLPDTVLHGATSIGSCAALWLHTLLIFSLNGSVALQEQ